MGSINLSKGDKPVKLSKTDLITLKCSWPAATDYDLYAIVVYADGSQEYIATFGAGKSRFKSTYTHPAKLCTDDGSILHHGDARRGAGTATEIIDVRLTPDIKAVIPVAYSAQSNGTGSFYAYKVTTEIVAGDQHAVVKAENASNDKRVYSLIPGMIVNEGESFSVHALELYSGRNSELRPVAQVVNGDVIPVMDQGPKNEYK